MKRFIEHPAAVPLLVAGVAAIAAALRVAVATQDLFADELATHWIVSSSDGVGDVVRTVSTTAEITPPLSFVLSWMAARIDLSAEMLRLPSLIAGIATIPIVYAVGARTVGREAGLLACVITALSPFMIFYSAEARGYGLLMALVLLSTLSMLLAIDRGQRRWWVAYACFVCASAYTHYTSIFVLAVQVLWVLWAHPPCRRAMLLASAAAALAFLPWIPGLRGDLDSPTTEILGALSPFTPSSIKLSLGHWAIGFPYANVTPLHELPGTLALVLLGATLLLAGAGLVAVRDRLRRWLLQGDRRLLLLMALALATPLGEAAASLIGSNIFGTRSLAASWPYLALAGAGLLGLAPVRLRYPAAALAVAAFAMGAVKMVSPEHERPNFDEVADYAGRRGGAVVDVAAFTPGPLANFDVSTPGVPVLRLNIPEEDASPFDYGDRPPDPARVARRAVRAAAGGPITLVTTRSGNPIAGARPGLASQAADRFVAALPPSYELRERRSFEGMLELAASVYERRPTR